MKSKIVLFLLFCTFSSFAQIQITGKVTDKGNEPLPGVTVVIKGSTQGTVSSIDGAYVLPNVPSGATLVFSFVGMKPKEIAVGDQTSINVTLEEESIGIDEVIAIGYGTIKKSDLTGSVSVVNAEDLQTTSITSIDQGLTGRAAGVQVTQTSGMPGAVATIKIRGTNSLQAGTEPLYVIDGFPVYNGMGYDAGGSGPNSVRTSGLSAINPNDIESIEILKDAAATAIYGSRGGNGVVLVTTKSGKSGKDIISFSAYYGVQTVTQKLDLMNGLEYAELLNEVRAKDGDDPYYGEAAMAELRSNPKGTDWQDLSFQSAPVQDYQVTFSGGDKKSTYAISCNYFSQDGVVIGSDFKRFSGRINLDRHLNDKLSVGTRVSLSRTMQDSPLRDVVAVTQFNPNMGIWADEELGLYNQQNIPGVQRANPVATAWERVDETLTNRLLGNIFVDWKFAPDFNAKISFGTDFVDRKNNEYHPSSIYESGGNADGTVNSSMGLTWLNENIISWQKKFGDHSLNVLAGATIQQTHSESVMASSLGFVNDVLEANALENGVAYAQPNSGKVTWGMISYLGRVHYNLKEKYIVSVNARYDGSSRFGAKNKYGFFPSTAVAWRAIEEDFIQNLNVFSNLKVRVSYGLSGNQEIPNFLSLPTMQSTVYTIGGASVVGYRPNQIPNPELKWETSAQANIGVDMGFLDNRIQVTADVYHKKTSDLLYQVQIPYTSGFGSLWKNVGSIENKGIELGISSDNLKGPLSWTTNFNISFNKNEVLELGGEPYSDLSSYAGQVSRRLIVGEEVGVFYGYKTDGLFQNQTELDAGPTDSNSRIGGRRYLDLNGDGAIEAVNDRTIIGSANPDFIGGMGNTFSYKGFELNVFTTWSYGNEIYNFGNEDQYLPTGGQNLRKEMVNRWSGEGTSNHLPGADSNRASLRSDAYVEDGSNFKIKTLTLAYTFPNLKSKAFKSLKIYVTGQNLFTFTNYSGFDPEVSARGASALQFGEDFGTYPQTKSILFGIKFDL